MNCPSREEFVQCLVGNSPASSIEAVYDHLEQCVSCQTLVETLDDVGDDVVSTLRTENKDVSITPSCEKMMTASEQILENMSTGGPSNGDRPAPPEFIRDYRLLDPIGEGGMGTLYRAIHTRLKRPVAVKLLAHRQMHNEAAINRFMREMEAVGKLEHPNIVRALDAGEHEGLHYLVMELVEGLDLRQILKRVGSLSIADACEVARQAAEGLYHAHCEELVHRDVKPSNLMIASDGRVKLLDLGLALLHSDVSGELTTSELAVGSIDYMAPEQADDSHSVDAKADIYSLGCTMYHLLCGHPPFFNRDGMSLIQRITAHATANPPPINEIRSDAPPRLLKLISTMLSKSPDKRPLDMAVIASALAPLTEDADLIGLLQTASKMPATTVPSATPSRIAKQPPPDIEQLSPTATHLKPIPAEKSPSRSTIAHENKADIEMVEVSTELQCELLQDLTKLVTECRSAEVEIRSSSAEHEATRKSEYKSRREKLISEFETSYAKLTAEYRESREATISKFEADGYELAEQEKSFADEAALEHAVALENAKQDWQIANKQLAESLDAGKDLPDSEFQQIKERCAAFQNELEKIEKQSEKVLRRRGCEVNQRLPEPRAIAAADRWRGDDLDQFVDVLRLTQQRLDELHNRPAARFSEDGWPWLIFVLTALAAAIPAWQFLSQQVGLWIGVCVGAGLIIAVAVRQIMRSISRLQTLRALPAFQQTLVDAKSALDAAVGAAKSDVRRMQNEFDRERQDQAGDANMSWAKTRNDIKTKHESMLRKAAQQFDAQRREITEIHDRKLAAFDREYPPRIKQMEEDFEATLKKRSDAHREKVARGRQAFKQQWSELVSRWKAGISDIQAVVEGMNRACGSRFPDWDKVDWQSWQPPADALSALRFGNYSIDPATIENGLPQGKDFELSQSEFTLPAVLTYPSRPSLILQAEGDGRDLAVLSLQNVMLRLLTSLPPGKIRYTIIDPVGLGQNFSMFMHLADYDERLVNNRIWTESAHINKRLTDLTEHMENVIQKYLRNEFESIQDYNQHAGEVAEPFQILVIANFPANFAEESARRLVSIVSSGARCGVYTLISTDMKMKLPRNFDLEDLERHAATLVWNSDQFGWKRDELSQLPLTLDTPPDDDRFTAIVRAFGQAAKDTSRVEVPFQTVVAEQGDWWSGDSRREIAVPLGRAGATKLQFMRLGKGTSQHVLISGKTGSGKSTLLHALITNLSIYYSPDEIQFYLIDFKKGVEFKPYATLKLPHARVIAIESEREFGMSVLERLDLELRQRGDLFRAAGVQDIHGYRDANPDAVMPRVMLIVDEFQELFVSDDKIAQDASLLLDRLVRQGRAFGIHVLLGSQTLAGAYSLARSTLGQMAVRVALQCSEADAHLILSEDNTAARLLNRPGEAIYNDANGLFEGNHPFQVVWLSDSDRETYLRQIAEEAHKGQLSVDPPIVFEGNVAADPSENRLLRKSLQDADKSETAMAPQAWLGSAVAIKDPTAITFRRQNGSNLLMVGQQEEMAMGTLANCLISLGAQCGAGLQPANRPANASNGFHQFCILDGTRAESPDVDFWNRITRQIPMDIKKVSPRELANSLPKIAEEVDRRLQANDTSAFPIFLVVYNLSRFRDLKKSDDFSFSSDDGPPSLEKQFATILREGPEFGVHTLIWCDSYTNANRWLDRQVMHDLELRVLFQMSATDSSNLMDSPEASRLGVHRAILYSEEQGQSEKFRPYGPPSEEWLAWVKQQLGNSPSGLP